MKNYTLLLFAFLTLGYSAIAQQSNDRKIVFYNTENLFDTIDDPKKMDEEFLPSAKMQWNSERYQKKLDNISKVLTAIGHGNLPIIAGFCEVENKSVLKDLITKTDLKNGNYDIVHEDSPDARGIDVGMIYQTQYFKHLYHKAMVVNFEGDTTKTRDILYVKGIAGKSDTLHLFINHWPSRRGGEGESETKRIVAAKVLKAATDSILSRNKNAKIVMMGDFNDAPDNKSIHEILNASNNQVKPAAKELYNMMYNKYTKAGEGSHNHQGHWMMLDQMIVSNGLINSASGISVAYDNAYVYKPEWLLYTDKKSGEFKPNRTYAGPNYLGGYSDHLPIYLILENLIK